MQEMAAGNGQTPRHRIAVELSDLIALLRKGGCGPRIVWLIVALVAIIAATNWFQILLNAWNKPFYDSLTRKDLGAFLSELRVFAELAAVLLVLNVSQQWLDLTLKLTLRRGLFGALLGEWMKPGRAEGVAHAGLIGVNPDQRLQIDADTLADLTCALGIGLFQSSLLLFSFIGVLWEQSGTVAIPLGGRSYDVPGFMVWCALLYSLTASCLSWAVGRPLVEINAERSAREAAFRFELVRVSEAREDIALRSGEATEAARIAASFEGVVDIVRAAIRATIGLSWVTAGYGWIAIVAPILAAAPFYFTGHMTIGELMLIVGAFNQVQSSLRWFVGNFAAIANWRATLIRVTSFHRALAELDPAAPLSMPHIDRREQGHAIEIAGLRVVTPYLCVRLAADPLVLVPGDRVLLRGDSGSGKTILFRTLAGFWQVGEGRIVMPEKRLVHYLPTSAYVPPGVLADSISYPRPAAEYAADEIASAVRAVGLEQLVPQLAESERWDQVLSSGERQCIAFARALLQKPEWLVADDAMMQLDSTQQAMVAKLFDGPLSGTGLLGIGNGTEPASLYGRVVEIISEPGVTLGSHGPGAVETKLG